MDVKYASKPLCPQQGTDMLQLTVQHAAEFWCFVKFLPLVHTDTRRACCHAPKHESLRLLQVC